MRIKHILADIFYALIIISVIAGTVIICALYVTEELSEEHWRTIFVSETMDVYVGQTARITPSLIDDDGVISDAIFDYSSDSKAIKLDSLDPGKFTVTEYADEPQLIHITELASGATATVAVTVVSDKLTDIVSVGLDVPSAAYGDTMEISVRTLPKNCDFSRNYTCEVRDESGTSVDDVFRVSEDRSGIYLECIGLGRGTVTLKFSNPDRGLEYSETLSFDISLADADVSAAVVKGACEGGLAGAEDLSRVGYIEIESISADLSCLGEVPSVNSVYLSGARVFSSDVLPENITYFVPDSLLGDYFADVQWKTLTECIYPDAAKNGGICTVFHSERGEPHHYETGAAASITYAPVARGYTFVGWFRKEGGEQVVSVTASAHLYARWAANRYTVTFATGTLSGSIERDAVFDSPLIDFPVPVKPGYTFGGWYSEPEGAGTRFEDGYVYAFDSDATFYAFWNANTYSVTFDYQSDQSDSTLNVLFDTPFGSDMPIPLAKSDSVFGGWFTEVGGGGTEYAATSKVDFTSGITLYAKWTATIAFDYQISVGDLPETQEAVYNAYVESLPAPSPASDDCEFGGWYTEAGGKGIRFNERDKYFYDGGITLYAKWTVTVTFDYQTDGGTMPERQAVVYKDVISSLPAPVREGYDFGGWFVEAGGKGTQYAAGDTVDFTSGITLYAKWTTTIAFDYQLTVGGGLPVKQDAVFNTIISSLPEPAREGCEFGGWFTEAGGKGTQYAAGDTVDFTSGITLYAKWTTTVDFDYRLYVGDMPLRRKIVYNSIIDSLPEPAREGCEFGGWFAEAGGKGTQFKEGDTYLSGGNITLHAKWTMTITFDYQAADGGDMHRQQKAVYDTAITVLPVPTRTGYVFGGWYTEAGGGDRYTVGKTVDFTSSITLYARWYIPMIFDYQGATGGNSVEKIGVLYNSYIGADALPVPTRTGHCFRGWFERPDGGGEQYTLATIVTSPTAFTVYAYWNKETYIISYDSNGGSAVASTTVTYDNNLTLPADPARDEYDFIGWYLSEENGNGSGAKLTGGVVGDLGDYADGYSPTPIPVTVYARWEKITAVYYGNGTAADPYRIYYGYQLRDLADLVNGGRNFAGEYFALNADVSGLGNWTPIGNNNRDTYYSNEKSAVARRFAGVFDGGGHTVSGYIVYEGTDNSAEEARFKDTYAGLFGYIASGGVVKNLKVADITIGGRSTRNEGSKGGGHFGGIAGVSSGKISNCTVISGTVSGEAVLDTHVGGIVGYIFLSGSVVENCGNSAAVSGDAGRCVSHGGIVGSVNNGVVCDSTNDGAVTGINRRSGSYVNGVKGYTFLGGIAGVSCAVIIGCENRGDVTGGGWSFNQTGDAGSGGIVGYLHNGSDANTDSTDDNTLTINKDNGYYSAVVNCTASITLVGFVQNDSGNAKQSIAVTSGTTWKAVSGNVPVTIDASYYTDYFSADVRLVLFRTSVLTINNKYIIDNQKSEFIADNDPYAGISNLPSDVYIYIVIALSTLVGVIGAVVLAVGLSKRKKSSNRQTEDTNENKNNRLDS